MDPKKFDTCKEKVRQSVVVEIDKLLTSEWDRLIASIGAVCDMDEGFPLTITVNLTPHEGGIVHASSLKYKCSREASGEPGFVRYDGTETVQGELFEHANELTEELESLAEANGWGDLENILADARENIIESKSATVETLTTALDIDSVLAEKVLQLLEIQGFLGHPNGDEPRDIVSLREIPAESSEPVEEKKTAEVGKNFDPIMEAISKKGYPDKKTFLDLAEEQVVDAKRATFTIIQRRLQVPFIVAQWAIEQLQERGVVTAPDAEGKREVITAAESNAAAEVIANG